MNMSYKKLFLIVIYILLIKKSLNVIDLYDFPIEIINEKGNFFKYSKGYIYIGEENYINNIKNCAGENDILIIDNRSETIDDNPDMQILSSYKINDKDTMYEIINIMYIYEKINPSMWNRSKKAMYIEWCFHNIAYKFNYKISHSENVDFDNADEAIYSNKILKCLIK